MSLKFRSISFSYTSQALLIKYLEKSCNFRIFFSSKVELQFPGIFEKVCQIMITSTISRKMCQIETKSWLS